MTSPIVYNEPPEPNEPIDPPTTTTPIKYVFQSIQELGLAVRKLPKRLEQAGTGSKEKFCGFSTTQAIACAIGGGIWDQGAQGLRDIELETATLVDGECFSPNEDVAGYCPIVPNYLAGIPTDMLDDQEAFKPRKQLKIGVHIGRSWGIEESSTLLRGKCILSAIDYLELTGYDVELWAVWKNKSGDIVSDIQVCIKAMGESYVPASCALALCSTVVQRKLFWRIAESCPYTWKLTAGNYGVGVDKKEILKDGYDIALGYFSDEEPFEQSPELALETITQEFNKQIAAHNERSNTE